MLHSHHNNNKKKHLHQRCLQFVHNDKCHLMKNSWKKIGHIQRSDIEMLQINHGQSPKVFSDIFPQITRQYKSRRNRDFNIPSVNTVYHGSESIFYLSPEIWEILSVKIKEINSLNSFKKNQKVYTTKLHL